MWKEVQFALCMHRGRVNSKKNSKRVTYNHCDSYLQSWYTIAIAAEVVLLQAC